MKKVIAVIRPLRLEAVKAALADEAGVLGLTVTDVRGPAEPLERAAYAAPSYGGAPLVPKIRLETVARDGDVAAIVAALLTHARTGAPGDGKVFVLDVEEALRIRTGDRGDAAVG